MAIPDNISAALADKPEVLEYVKGLDATAAKFTPDLEAALPKLATLPQLEVQAAALAKVLAETKAESADKLLADFKNILAVKDDLQKQKDVWKAGGKGADSPEYKAIEEKLAEIQKASEARIKALEDESKTSKESAAQAITQKRETDLKSTVIAAASKHKIRDAEDEFILLKAKGLVGHKDDGTPFFHKLNEKGEKVAVTSADDLMKHIAETNKAKVDASGKAGTGQDHKGTGGDGSESPKTAADARRAFMNR